MTEPNAIARDLRAPRAAGVAGVIFALLLGLMVLLVRRSGGLAENVTWVTTASTRRSVTLAISLTPFAGIAFLWFIGVIRSRLGAREDKLFATVFLGSGLLFLAMLFSAAAVRGTALSLYPVTGPVSVDTVRLTDTIASILLNTFGGRMAAVFVMSVTSIGARSRVFPRWLTVVGFVCALLLILLSSVSPYVVLLFPLWVLVLSLHILAVTRVPGAEDDFGPPA